MPIADKNHPGPIDLSIVVTVVSGAEATGRILRRLIESASAAAEAIEILVPIEDDRAEVAGLAGAFPVVRFLRLRSDGYDTPSEGAFQEHERFDRRRAAALEAARGRIVAIVEDHGVPREDWIDAVLRAHREDAPHAVGGVVENGVDAALEDALWLADFWRYVPPIDAGTSATLTDVNVSYRRTDLAAIREAWFPRFHEPLVHGALREKGIALLIDPSLVVRQMRPRLGLRTLLAERIAWGRLFGRIRGARLTSSRRLLYTLGSLVIAPLLFVRILRATRSKIGTGRLLRATPWLLILLLVWCMGESVGTLEGRSVTD